MAKKWYIVHVYSGFENKVKTALEERIAAASQQDQFGECWFPLKRSSSWSRGSARPLPVNFIRDNILVRMDLTDETWHTVNDTAKVTGFLGGRNQPTPLSDDEAEQILNRMEAGKLKPQPKYYFDSGDEIRVIDGPFTNFNGTVEEVNPEKGKIKVLVSIFGRSTPVELDFVQVTKL